MLYFDEIYLEKCEDLRRFRAYLDSQEVFEEVDNFILIKSLPRQYPEFEINEILNELGLYAKNQYEIGYNCTTILNAFNIVNSIKVTKTVIYIADSFESYISKELQKIKASTKDWNNYSSGIVFKNNGKYAINIIDSNAISDNMLSKFSYFNNNKFKHELCFDNQFLPLFKDLDLKNELRVIEKTLSNNNAVIEDVEAVIVTNRETQRTEMLRETIGIKEGHLISSRQMIGHTGCSDILFNLDFFIREIFKNKENILITANGLGYTWSCMLLTLIRLDDGKS